MEGVIKEGAEALCDDGNDTVLDSGIIGAGSRVEHYEMAGYLTAISLAEQMEEKQIVSLLKQSLAEEQAAEEKLRKIAAQLIKKNAPRQISRGVGTRAASRRPPCSSSGVADVKLFEGNKRTAARRAQRAVASFERHALGSRKPVRIGEIHKRVS
jgi:hypothetical protein